MSFVSDWRKIRKGFSKLMEVNSRIGEEADYKAKLDGYEISKFFETCQN